MDRPLKEEESFHHDFHREDFGQSFLPFNNIYTNPEVNASFNNPFSMENTEHEFHDLSGFSYIPEPAFKFSNIEDPNSAVQSAVPTNETQSFHGELQLSVVEQPPVEVRTRTPNEKRTFGCAVFVNGDYQRIGATHIAVEVAYARGGTTERPDQKILGGNKLVKIGGGLVPFDDLSMCEASTKHKGSEFCLEFYLAEPDGQHINHQHFVSSRPFYAYSNQKVLARRRNVDLRALSKPRGSSKGGELMHVIGSPFIASPSLQVRVSTAHGEVSVGAANVELYSESVLFFPLPAYPLPPPLPDGLEMRAQVRVSNDGRHFSNPVDFTYYVENEGPKRLRSRF